MALFLFNKKQKSKSKGSVFFDWLKNGVSHDIEKKDFLNFINSILDGVAVIDFKGKILFFNLSASKILEIDNPKKWIGKSFLNFLPVGTRPIAVKDMAKVKIGRGGYLQTYKIKTAKGKEMYIENIGTKTNLMGRSVIVISFRDISGRIYNEINLKEETRKSNFLRDVIITANKPEDLNILLNDILNLVLEFFDFDGGGIYLMDKNKKTATVLACKNLSKKFINETKTVHVKQKPYDKIFIKAEPSIIEHYQKIHPERAKKFGFKSLASIPLSAGNEVIGALNIISKKRSAFTESEKQLLSSIGGQLGGAIRKTASENELKKSRARYKTIMDNTMDIIYSIDMTGKIIFISPNVSLWGYNFEEVLGRNIYDFIHRDDIDMVRESLKKSLRENRPFYTNFRLLKKNGNPIYAEEFGRALFGDKGEVVMFTGIVRDVTERKKHEESSARHTLDLEKTKKTLSSALEAVRREKIISENLAADLEKFKLAVDGASDHIIITDLDANIVYANAATERVTGFSFDEMIGKNPGELWGGQMKKDFYAKMWKIIKINKKVYYGEVKNKRKNGEVYDAEVHISPILDNKGNVLFFVGIEKDITSAKNIDRAKTEFISIASHQLRTPLTGVKWFSELLLASGDKLPKKQYDYIKKIYGSNQKMIYLVKDLLDVSRIESGEKYGVKKKKINIISIIKRVVSEQSVIYKSKRIKFKLVNCQDSLFIQVDEDKIYQALQNIIGNATKYSKTGGEIEIGNQKNKKTIVFFVRDYGLGIPDKAKEQVFTKFYRASNVIETGNAGTGLGLYIAKSIIEAHGGRIWFDSKENKGATFYFELPIN